MRQKFLGQSFTEYCLAIALISLSSLGVLAMVGTNITAKAPAILPMPTAPPTTGAGTNTNGSNSTSNPSTTGGNTPSPSGSSSNQPLPSDLSKVLQAAGVNGTTEVLADQIRQIAQHLLDTGKLTPDQANYFFVLANEGNRISSIEKLIEDANRTGAKTVTFDGKTTTPYDLAESVGWTNEPSQYYNTIVNTAGDMMSRAPDNRSVEMQSFIDKYQQLVNSGAMSNPDVQNVISNLTAKIATLSEVTEAYTSDAHWGTTLAPTMSNYAVSQTSFWHSSNICATGAGKTVGVTCQ
jgi:hypothetical protein